MLQTVIIVGWLRAAGTNHCGVVACCRRIIMLLCGDWSFAPSLRAPAISRLQKVHNVELVFSQLTKRGFDLKTAKGGCLHKDQLTKRGFDLKTAKGRCLHKD